MSVPKNYPSQIRIGSHYANAFHIDRSGNKSLPPIHFSIFFNNGHVSMFTTLEEAQEITSRLSVVMEELLDSGLEPEDFEDTDQDPLAV